VIFIQNDGSSFQEFISNTNERELLNELAAMPKDILVDKYTNDVFYKSELQKILI
jgi:hypothetical protein